MKAELLTDKNIESLSKKEMCKLLKETLADFHNTLLHIRSIPPQDIKIIKKLEDLSNIC